MLTGLWVVAGIGELLPKLDLESVTVRKFRRQVASHLGLGNNNNNNNNNNKYPYNKNVSNENGIPKKNIGDFATKIQTAIAFNTPMAQLCANLHQYFSYTMTCKHGFMMALRVFPQFRLSSE